MDTIYNDQECITRRGVYNRDLAKKKTNIGETVA